MRRPLRRVVTAACSACTAVVLAGAASAHADAVAYLVNVTVRPGYNFAGADAALAYGYSVCDRVGRNTSYAETLTSVKSDFGASDDYQAAYLVNQAVNELCPALIWQLRRSAAHYTGGPDG